MTYSIAKVPLAIMYRCEYSPRPYPDPKVDGPEHNVLNNLRARV
jgi:hypothetical protein